MNWQEFLLKILNSQAAGMLILAAVTAIGTWIIRRLKLTDVQRQQALDCLKGGVEYVWENHAKNAKAQGVKLTEAQRAEFRRQAIDYATGIAKDLGVDLGKVFPAGEVMDGIIREIISARRLGETKAAVTAAELAKTKIAAIKNLPDGWTGFVETPTSTDKT